MFCSFHLLPNTKAENLWFPLLINIIQHKVVSNSVEFTETELSFGVVVAENVEAKKTCKVSSFSSFLVEPLSRAAGEERGQSCGTLSAARKALIADITKCVRVRLNEVG